jgi:hypothetical protein
MCARRLQPGGRDRSPPAAMASTKVFDNRLSCAIYERFKG